MKNNFLYITFILSSLLAITACSNDEGTDIPTEQKTPIQLSVGKVSASAISRAITVEPTSPLNSSAFAEATDLYLAMKSEADGKGAMWTMTKGSVDANAETVSFGTGCVRYWDDCYARDAKLSVYGICTPGTTPKVTAIGGKSTYTHTTNPTTGAWGSDYTPSALTIENWEVSNAQTTETLAQEDLCYSNNIAKYTINSTETDKRLGFNTETKLFEGGQMYFYHAMSKITFNIKKSAGYLEDTFAFAENTNIKLTGFNTKNTQFTIASDTEATSGTFTGTSSSSVIATLAQRATATTGYEFTLDALTIPGTDMSTTTKGDITFTINNNKYDLSKKDLLDAIPAGNEGKLDGSKLKPGVQYIFNITISKARVDKITAQIVDWEVVTADEQTVDNAKVTVSGLNDSGEHITGFSLYRTADAGNNVISDSYEGYNWNSAYEGPATMTLGASNVYSTEWFWDDNIKFYHFRSLINATLTSESEKNYVKLTSKEKVSDSNTYADVQWGAPFVALAANGKFAYDTTNGFDGATGHQIYKAIGATHDAINLTMFHMMSDVTFVIKTTTGNNKVTLVNAEDKKTTIKLQNICKDGKVQMGNGLVTTTSNGADFDFTTPSVNTSGEGAAAVVSNITWNAGFVPQSLANVNLVITTPDGNEYIIKMADVIAASPSYQKVTYPAYNDSKVNYWYPGVKYTYTFTLTKTGIENITANLTNWEEVNAGNDNVQIQ